MLTCSVCGRESPEDFAFCPSCASPLAPAAGHREVRKTVSIVFCDVTGSTAMGEGLDPEALRAVLSRYFDTMRAAIERHGGTVEKYIGDAVMAVFGIPKLHEDDALRASRAALDMSSDLALLNKELERDRGVTIKVRIGVNTGEVVSSDAAGGEQLVTGDAVNVAARLEQHAAPGEILLGDTTYRLVRDAVEVEPVEPLSLKGKSEPTPAWRLLEVREVASATPRHLEAPMIGRERQLTQLRHAFEAATEEQHCQLFTVLGPAGVGKSRLVEEFVGDAGDDVAVLRGRCLPYGDGITYFPVIEAIKEAAGLADFDLPDVIERKVCSVVDTDEHQELVCRHVSQLLGVADAVGGDDTFWAIRRFFEAVARSRPLVLVFDDIHWGEPTFLDLIEHIVDWSRGSTILLVCMARSDLLDVRPSWAGGKRNATTVSLEPLTAEQAAGLVTSALGERAANDVVERIVQAAEGNPLFLEQTLAMLIDDGKLAYADGGWAIAADVETVRVPPTIQALLAARLDQLDAAERTTVEAASVIGKEFYLGAVRALVAEESRGRVAADLMSAVRRELVRQEPSALPGEDAFRFRHQLVRDAAYDAIPKAERAEMHERFADWLEAVAGESIAEQEEIVGYHLERAVLYRRELGPDDDVTRSLARRASERLARSGRRAGDRGDHAAALRLQRRALELASPGDPGLATLLYDIGNAETEMARPDAALQSFERATALALENGDEILAWLTRIGATHQRVLLDPLVTRTDDVMAELSEAIEVFERAEDDRALGTAWALVADLGWIPCLFDQAKAAGERAVEHAVRAGDARLLARSVVTAIAAGLFGSEHPRESLLAIDRALELVGPNLQIERFAAVQRAMNAAMLGDVRDARSVLENISGRAKVDTAGFEGVATLEALGNLDVWDGDLAAAEAHFRTAYEELHARGDDAHASTEAANLARTLCWSERFDEAEASADIAIATGAADDLATQVPASIAKAWARASRGDFGGLDAAVEAAHRYDDAESPNTQGDAWLDVGRVFLVAGRASEARDAIARAIACFERKGNVPMTAIARSQLERA